MNNEKSYVKQTCVMVFPFVYGINFKLFWKSDRSQKIVKFTFFSIWLILLTYSMNDSDFWCVCCMVTYLSIAIWNQLFI